MELKGLRDTRKRLSSHDRGQGFDNCLDVGRFDLIFPSELHEDIGFGLASFLYPVVVDELEVGIGTALGIL